MAPPNKPMRPTADTPQPNNGLHPTRDTTAFIYLVKGFERRRQPTGRRPDFFRSITSVAEP